jgi:hypothetical protein
MKAMLKRSPDGFGKGKKIRQTVTAALLGLGISLTAGSPLASNYEGEDNNSSSYESIFFGTVEKAPQGNIGTWVISKRDIAVTRETRISERHGKAVPGAYVKVEGMNTGKAFTAHKIEVKRSKRQ